jgi:hypothetical protein
LPSGRLPVAWLGPARLPAACLPFGLPVPWSSFARPPAARLRLARSQRGQILPLVALFLVALGGATLLIGRLGGAAVARARARTAADAAALAGASSGREAAAELAQANGGRLVGFEARGGQAFVRVVVGRAVATARARRGERAGGGAGGFGGGSGGFGGGSGGFGGGPPARRGLSPAHQAALARAGALLGRAVPVTSGYRSPAQQASLYARRGSNPYPVARPGFSAHERGTAVDVPLAFVPALLSVARQVGLCQPYPQADPVHFELCR